MHTDKLSLHYDTWVEHASSLHLAVKILFDRFSSKITDPDPAKEILRFGLFKAMGLLYGTTVESLIKARILFEKREAIEKGEITSFQQLVREWPGNGLDVFHFPKMN